MISHLLAAFQRWRLYRLTVAELSSLTDRQLADLGISRTDIYTVARETAHG